jgi:hypothetical protein
MHSQKAAIVSADEEKASVGKLGDRASRKVVHLARHDDPSILACLAARLDVKQAGAADF